MEYRVHESGLIWTRKISEFPSAYDQTETCYIVQDEVTVTPDDGEPQTYVGGDLVTFPKGLSCNRKIIKAIGKYFDFD